jgi:manganese oxidase
MTWQAMMRVLIRRWLCSLPPLLVTLALTSPVSGQVAAGTNEDPGLKQLIRRLYVEGKFHGGILIGDGVKVILREAWGVGDHDAGLVLTPEHRFSLNSLGKMFTAIAIMQLVEQGRLGLDDPLSRRLSDFEHARAGDITIQFDSTSSNLALWSPAAARGGAGSGGDRGVRDDNGRVSRLDRRVGRPGRCLPNGGSAGRRARSYARAVDLAERQRHGGLPVFRLKLEWLSRRLEVPHPPASVSDKIGANDNRTPAGAFENGTFVVHLEARIGAWRPRLEEDTAISALAFAERGHAPSIPWPLIRVPQGTGVRLTVRNDVPPGFPVQLPPSRFQDVGLSTVGSDVLIVHGLRAGTVAEDTVRVPTGATREVTFRADRPGTYVYWGALTEATMEQRRTRDATLSGVIIVDPAGSAPDPDERIFVITMIDAFPDTTRAEANLDVFEPVINGLSWPHTERLEYAAGDTIRWRWVNASGQEHPMHLHGFHFRTLGRSEAEGEVAFTADSTYWAVTDLVEPGAMVRMEWVPTRPGNWLMHCHNDNHVVAVPDPEHGTDMHDDDDVTNHPLKMMMGLVLGITVTPDAEAVDLPPRQQLRLTAQERVVPGSDVARGFVLEGGRQPSAFSSPGPPLILMRDETTQITVVNGIAQPTSIHWHGMELESVYDGVAGWARTGSRIAPLIAPGDSFIVQMTPPRAGTYMYHTHMGHTDQLVSGLYGPLIVLEPGQTFDPDTDLLFLVGGAVHEGEHWDVTLNGRMEPPPRVLRAGTRYRLRFMNISPGATVEVWLEDENGSVPWTALAVDGADLSDALRIEDTRRLRFNAGQTFDFHWTPAAAGSVTLVLHHIFATFPGSDTIRQPLEIR